MVLFPLRRIDTSHKQTGHGAETSKGDHRHEAAPDFRHLREVSFYKKTRLPYERYYLQKEKKINKKKNSQTMTGT